MSYLLKKSQKLAVDLRIKHAASQDELYRAEQAQYETDKSNEHDEESKGLLEDVESKSNKI